MSKYDLVTGVSKATGIRQADVDAILTAAFECIRQAVSDGQRVRIKNFGTFRSRTRAQKTGRNLQGGKPNPEPLIIPTCTVAVFKPSKTFIR